MGKEHQKLEKSTEAAKELLQEKNKLLKQTNRLIKTGPRPTSSPSVPEPEAPAEPEFESADEIPEEDEAGGRSQWSRL